MEKGGEITPGIQALLQCKDLASRLPFYKEKKKKKVYLWNSLKQEVTE